MIFYFRNYIHEDLDFDLGFDYIYCNQLKVSKREWTGNCVGNIVYEKSWIVNKICTIWKR
jgi:phosphoserine phosphatase